MARAGANYSVLLRAGERGRSPRQRRAGDVAGRGRSTVRQTRGDPRGHLAGRCSGPEAAGRSQLSGPGNRGYHGRDRLHRCAVFRDGGLSPRRRAGSRQNGCAAQFCRGAAGRRRLQI